MDGFLVVAHGHRYQIQGILDRCITAIPGSYVVDVGHGVCNSVTVDLDSLVEANISGVECTVYYGL